jgi:hypothetical protein
MKIEIGTEYKILWNKSMMSKDDHISAVEKEWETELKRVNEKYSDMLREVKEMKQLMCDKCMKNPSTSSMWQMKRLGLWGISLPQYYVCDICHRSYSAPDAEPRVFPCEGCLRDGSMQDLTKKVFEDITQLDHHEYAQHER